MSGLIYRLVDGILQPDKGAVYCSLIKVLHFGTIKVLCCRLIEFRLQFFSGKGAVFQFVL